MSALEKHDELSEERAERVLVMSGVPPPELGVEMGSEMFVLCEDMLAVAFAPNGRKSYGERRWSWRGSNPRPDNEPLSLLHVYFVINFRPKAGYKHPTLSLALKISHYGQSFRAAISRFVMP